MARLQAEERPTRLTRLSHLSHLSLGTPARECLQGQRGFILGMACYVVAVVAAAAILNALSNPPQWVGGLLAAPAIAAAAFALFSQRHAMRRREGVERLAYVESTALAFWIVMISALSWFFLEAWAGLARPSALWVWLYGMTVMGVVSLVIRRRLG